MTNTRLTPLSGGNGAALASAVRGPSLAAAGWSQTEYVATGTARRYDPVDLAADGRWAVEPGAAADFATRLLVRRPPDGGGTLVVEWLNVSAGADAAPGWTYLAEELVRSGVAWAGVSAQWGGVETGPPTVEMPAPVQGLRDLDPARYGVLRHPGDAYSYDIVTQVTATLRNGFARVLAVGESQSAYALTTYANAVQPLARAFDGFLIHSRGGAPAPLGEPGRGLDLAASRTGPAVPIRDDLDVPVFVVETETDLLGDLAYLPARQPDTDRFRLWEIAGSAHADRFLIGPFEEWLGCPEPVNAGQQAYVVRAALRHLDGWAGGGAAPPVAPLLDVVDGAFVTDPNGNVSGGVRTPVVDAPVETLSGLASPGASLICRLFGRTEPFTAERLEGLYPARADYLAAYERATDAAIAAGFVLAEDRAAVLAEARPFPA